MPTPTAPRQDHARRKTLRKRYKIIKKLGGGGFGDTYLAEDGDLPDHPLCVVKHLKPKATDVVVLQVARRLFETEAKVLHRLGKDYDQIPRPLAHFEENGEFYLVQEFVAGHDLSQELTPGKRLSENEVVRLLQDILKILVFVHQHNVVHRDIKPQNIMRRREDGKLVLIDFGLVKEISILTVNNQGQTSVTVPIGTPGYMPSEQSNGHPKLCSDVYAVGMIGIQALTGVLPHKLQKDPNTLEVIWRDRVRVSDTLADVLTKMVRYDFTQRYHSAVEALQALLPSVAQLPLSSSCPYPDATVENFNRTTRGIRLRCRNTEQCHQNQNSAIGVPNFLSDIHPRSTA